MSTKKEHTVKRILSERMEELKASQNARLDEIEKFVQGELKKINERNKAVNGFVVGNNSGMQQKLYNMELTIDALKTLLAEANLTEGLEEKLAAKREELHMKYTKQAEEKMKQDMQQAEQPAEAAPAQQAEEVKQEQAQG